MSLSTQPFKGFFSDGWHLVAIMEAKQQSDGILITFADGNNNKRQELFKMDKCFIKMCSDAGLITDESVFDSRMAVGARLMIEIVEGMLTDTKEYNANEQFFHKIADKTIAIKHNHPLEVISHKVIPVSETKSKIIEEQRKIIAEQRAMINKIESGKSNEFDM